jgi:hypothetical protein
MEKRMMEQWSLKHGVLDRVLSIALLLCLATPAVLLAGNDDEGEPVELVGTWRVTILPTQLFSLMVFDRGGTMTERVANGPSTVSVSSGVWKPLPGRGRFAAMFELFIDSDSDGFFDQRSRVRLTIQLLDDDRLTATATADFLTLDGTGQLAGPFPGIGLEGTRMRVIRE